MGLRVFHHLSMKAGSEGFTVIASALRECNANWFLSKARLQLTGLRKFC